MCTPLPTISKQVRHERVVNEGGNNTSLACCEMRCPALAESLFSRTVDYVRHGLATIH